jgi:23S rRNA G2445 N2-methylase RlmL
LIVDYNLRGGDSIYEFTKSNVNWMNYYPINQSTNPINQSTKSKFRNESAGNNSIENVIEKEGGLISVNARLYECDDINSSYLIEKRVRDAICDQIRDKTGIRPRPPHNSNNHNINNIEFIDLPIFVIAHKNIVTLFRDMSGDSLHHRYYKDSVIHKASLNETWAAGILYEADWKQKVFIRT